MPTVKSPQKRTRKNSVGETPTPAPAAPPTVNMDQGAREFLLAFEKRLSERMDGIAVKVQANSDRISEVKEDMNKKLELHKKETRDEIERAVRDLRGSTGGKLSRKQEEAYELHRRSLRMWPIAGPNYAENIKSFLQKKLCLPSAFLADMGQIEFKKYYNTRQKTSTSGANTPIANEMIVTFKTREARDKVKSAGFNLAGQGEAGLRIHVPGFLQESFNSLQSLGFHMKQKEAEVRRSVKFDDEQFDLVMDIKIDGNWKRITAEQAKEISKQNPEISSGPERMSNDDITSFLNKK